MFSLSLSMSGVPRDATPKSKVLCSNFWSYSKIPVKNTKKAHQGESSYLIHDQVPRTPI